MGEKLQVHFRRGVLAVLILFFGFETAKKDGGINTTNYKNPIVYDYCDDDGDGITQVDLEELIDRVESQVIADLLSNDILPTVIIGTDQGNLIKVEDVEGAQTITQICSLGASVQLFDVSVDSNEDYYGISPGSIFRINDNCSRTTITSVGIGNALSFDKSDNLYFNNFPDFSSPNPRVYRLDAGLGGTPYVWHEFEEGYAAGDFVMLNGHMYIAWIIQTGFFPVSYLYKVTVDADNQYVSHEDLGTIKFGTTGLASELGVLYGISDGEIYRIDLGTNPLSQPTVMTNEAELGLWWGGSGLHEALEIESTVHISQSDADNDANPLSNPWSNTNPNQQTIYVRTENTTTGEYIVTEVQINVREIPEAPTGDNQIIICSSDGGEETLADIPVNGTDIQWYDAPTGGTLLLLGTPLLDGETYYASQVVNGCESADRLAVTVTIDVPPGPTGAANQVFCSSDTPTVADLVATGDNVQWYLSVSDGTPLPPTTELVNGLIYFASQTVGSCESVERLPVSVSFTTPTTPIGDANQEFCSSDAPTLASISVGGNGIQWYDVATGGSALAPNTSLTDGTTYYAAQTIGSCESTDRLAVSVTVHSSQPPTGETNQGFCSTESPTLADLVVVGNGIEWYDAATGGTNLPLTLTLTDGATYYASQVSLNCGSSDRLAVSVSLSSSTPPTGPTFQPFCASNSPTVADLAATGSNILWYLTPVGGTSLDTTTSLIDGTIYYASQTIGGCESTERLAVTVLVGIPPAPTGDASQTFCSSDEATIANLVVDGNDVQWYLTLAGGTALPITTSLTDGTTYYASQSIGGCEGTDRLAVAVTVTSPSTPTGEANQEFCQEDSPTIADIVVSGTNVQWYPTETGGTSLTTTTSLTNGTTYYASQIESGCESIDRLAVTVSVYSPLAPTGSTTQTFCAINVPTIADIEVTGSNVQWYPTAIGGSSLPTTTNLADGETYYASQTEGSCESDRLAVTVSFDGAPLPTGASTQSFCSTDTPTIADIDITGTDIQWYPTDVGGTVLDPSTNLIDGSTYYASQTIGSCESDRLAVTVSFDGIIAPTGDVTQFFCAIDNPTVADIEVTGNNVQWYSSAVGGNIVAPTTSLVNGTTYYASQTEGSCESTDRLAVTVSVNSSSAPFGLGSQPFCEFNTPTVAELLAIGSGIQWYNDAVGGTPLDPATELVDGETYHASQTVGGCESTDRLAVTVIVTSPIAPLGLEIQAFCLLDSPTLADIEVVGSGIKWYPTETGGTSLPMTTALVNETTYYASQTIAGCESVDRLAVTVIVGIPPAPTGPTPQEFCGIDMPTVADLVVDEPEIEIPEIDLPPGVEIPEIEYEIKWYDTVLGGTPLDPTTPLVDGATYYASLSVEGCEGILRLAVTVSVNSPLPPSGETTQTFCTLDSPTIADIEVSGTEVQWHDAATEGNIIENSALLEDGATYYASQTVDGCQSPDRLEVTVSLNLPAAPTGEMQQAFCGGDSPTIADLVVEGENITWYAAITRGPALDPTTPLVDGTTYFATQTIDSCESEDQLAVTVSIGAAPAPTGEPVQAFCSINTPTIGDIIVSGTNIEWHDAATGGSILPTSTSLVDGTTYYASQTIGSCASEERLAVTVTIGLPVAPTGPANQEFCSISEPTIEALEAVGDNIQWYDVATGGTVLPALTNLVDGTTYYASQTVDGCESTDRLAVTISINTSAAPTGETSQAFCGGDSPTIADLVVEGEDIKWYSAVTRGPELDPTTPLINGATYFATQTIEGCESADQLAVTVSIGAAPAPIGEPVQAFCSINTPTIGDIIVSGTNIQWHDAATGGSILPTSTSLLDGTTYYASQTIGSCASEERLAVTVTIGLSVAPIGPANQEFCSINEPTVASLEAIGNNIQWYDTVTGGSMIPVSTILVDGTTYYASQTIGGCESTDRLAITVSVNIPLAPTGQTTQAFCGVDSPTIADIQITGNNIQWYTTPSGGNILTTDTNLIDNATYYASQTIGDCESSERLAVNVSVGLPPAPTGSATQTFCFVDSPTIADLVVAGNNIQWYTASVGGSSLDITTNLVNETTYYASQTVGGCESSERLAITTLVGLTTPPTGSPVQTFCTQDAPTIADLMVTGSNVQWYDVAIGGSALPVSTSLVDGDTYYASQNVSGCESVNRLPVTINMLASPEVDSQPEPILICDVNQDGYIQVDLTVHEQVILGNQDSDDYIFNYFSDSDHSQLIQNPENYQTSSLEENIYFAVAHIDNITCSVDGSFVLAVKENLIAQQPSDYELCDNLNDGDDTNGFVSEFLLQSMDSQILQGLTENMYEVSYYTTQEAAENGDDTFLIDKNIPYTNEVKDRQTVYVRVDHVEAAMCPNTSITFDLVVNKLPHNITSDEVIIENNIQNVHETSTINITLGEGLRGVFEFGLFDNEGTLIAYQTEPMFENVAGGIYKLVIRSVKGCGEHIIDIHVIQIPSFFTPNDDGVNDTWNLKGVSEANFPYSEILIFDRFGKQVGETKLGEEGWSGVSDGKKLPSNDYWYTIKLVDNKGKTLKKLGNFALIRK